MIVPQAFTQPVYVTVTKAIGYAGLMGLASGGGCWSRRMTWPVDWIGAVVADGVELPDGCRHTDRISAMLTPR
jgi:hypothetical protein